MLKERRIIEAHGFGSVGLSRWKGMTEFKVTAVWSRVCSHCDEPGSKVGWPEPRVDITSKALLDS